MWELSLSTSMQLLGERLRLSGAAHLVVWIAEVFDLCLGELPHSQEPLPRGNLIPIRLTYLCGCKWQLVAIVVVKIPADGIDFSTKGKHSNMQCNDMPRPLVNTILITM